VITYKDKTLDYCIDCFNYIINNNYYQYIDKLKTIDCEQGLKNLIIMGIPLYFRDAYIENNQLIKEFYYNNQYLSGKLKTNLSDEQIEQLNELLKITDISNIKMVLKMYNL
jgi:hypothetical protein